MDEKEFFAKLSEIGPDGKFSSQFNATNNGVDLKMKKNNGNEDNGGKNAGKKDEAEIFDGPEGQLAVDVYQTPTSIIVESLVAGIKIEDLDISVSPDSLIIKGARRKEERINDKDYLYQECFWGRFSRSIILPEEVDAERANASFKNGVLKIVLPKINRQKSKKIKVRFD
ncbi:MAG: Hsp20/alpha crystallin family protein [Patescibacteria group bacterium]